MSNGRATGAGVALLVAAFVLLSAGTSGIAGPSRGLRSESAAAAFGSAQVAAAIVSLSHSAGPAGGVPLRCTPSSAASASCGPVSAARDGASTPSAWTNITSRVVPLPSPRLSTMTWDASDGYVLLYGAVYLGPNDSLREGKDTWSYSNGTWTNLTSRVVGGPPPTPEEPVLTYDPWTDEAILFGGISAASSNLSLTWTYHAGVWTNITATAGTPPSPRLLPVFVADLASHQMLLFGGSDSENDVGLDDTWLFTGLLWSNITGTVGTSPPSLQGLSGTYDPAEPGIVVLGTSGSSPPYVGETYLFTGGAWENLTANQSVPLPLLQFPSMGYAVSTSTVIVAASEVFTPVNGSTDFFPAEWSFAGGQWTNTTAGGLIPAGASGGTMTTDGNGVLLQFGGAFNSFTPVQWMYAYSAGPSAVQVSATPATADVGVSTHLAASFSGGLAPETTTLAFGDGTSSNGTTAATHAYGSPGSYTVKFNVTDFAGRISSGSTSVTVDPAPSGVVVHASAATAPTGSTFNFTVTLVGGTAPFTDAWSFGDGSTAAATTGSHAYASAGNFTVRCTVTDADGKVANGTVPITVTAPPAGSGGSSSGSNHLVVIVATLVVVALIVLGLGYFLLTRRKSPPVPPLSAASWSAPSSGATAPPPPRPGDGPPPTP
ncbi:MAG: PKD domain-containing protein [Thermoplasmata archaeon]|nr:PKD domain-containing protein [Thermoplasmata archaeon]